MSVVRSILEPFEPPPQEFSVLVTNGNAQVVNIKVITQQLVRSPDYLFTAYAPQYKEPILQLISRPGVGELTDALRRAHTRAGKGHDAVVT